MRECRHSDSPSIDQPPGSTVGSSHGESYRSGSRCSTCPSSLDVVPVTGDETAEAALEHAGELARLADGLGYMRLWYAEHHNMPGIGTTTPEVLTARAASMTERIRVGSGGVMLPNHAPLMVAER